MEAAQIVGAHDPDEASAGTVRDEISQGVVSVTGANVGLQAGDRDAGVARKRMGGGQPVRERAQAARVLERIARGHQPPYPIKLKPPHSDETGCPVRLVW